MPINITQENGITKSHIAERLEINLLAANEDVREMQLKVYFNIETLYHDEKIAEPYWDGSNPLIFNCKDDPELEAAMSVIQNRIGQTRYAQLTTPPTTPPPTGLPPEVITN